MRTTLIFLVIFISYALFAQTDDFKTKNNGPLFELLDTNNISARINSSGTLFWDEMYQSKFYAPKNLGKTTIFAASLWMGGKSMGDVLHVSAMRYLIGDDLTPGPIANNYQDAMYVIKYKRVFKISRSQINQHIMNFNQPGYIMPEVIQNWPGNGNTANGEAFILAPFMDLNENGLYEPQIGEYPYIRGDQAIYFILNDDIPHTETYGNKFGIEQHVMAYAYDMPNNPDIQNTIFLTYQIINRSNTHYYDVYLGMWTDISIGDDFDDFIGCDTTLNFYYGYNGDDMDGNGSGTTFGAHPAAQGVVILNHPIKYFMFYNNGLGIMGDPVRDTSYYHYMTGKWNDGTPLTYGGNGYNGSTPTNFAFPGYPELGQGWYEDTTLIQNWAPFDRRGVASMGPFNLPAGGTLCVEVAFPYYYDPQGTRLSVLAPLRQRVQNVRSFFNNQNFNNCLTSPSHTLYTLVNSVCVYPNPFNGIITFRLGDQVMKHKIRIYDVLGKCVFENEKQENEYEVDLNYLQPGVYFYQIEYSNQILKGKLIKK